MSNFKNAFFSAATLALSALPICGVAAQAHAEPARLAVTSSDVVTPGGTAEFKIRTQALARDICQSRFPHLASGQAARAACEKAIRGEVQEKLAAIQASSGSVLASRRGAGDVTLER